MGITKRINPQPTCVALSFYSLPCEHQHCDAKHMGKKLESFQSQIDHGVDEVLVVEKQRTACFVVRPIGEKSELLGNFGICFSLSPRNGSFPGSERIAHMVWDGSVLAKQHQLACRSNRFFCLLHLFSCPLMWHFMECSSVSEKSAWPDPFRTKSTYLYCPWVSGQSLSGSGFLRLALFRKPE